MPNWTRGLRGTSPPAGLRRTAHVASAARSASPAPSVIRDSTKATLRAARTTSERTTSRGARFGARTIWYERSSVEPRSPDSTALFTAKFIAASKTTPYTPPCTPPTGLHTSSVGVHVASTYPSP